MFVALLAVYVAVYRRFVFGREFAFHDTMWDHHAFYAVVKQWLDAGVSIGWNPYMNGGEPLYLYSNLFLWAELIGFVALNWLLGIPTHGLINLYFAFILLSFATLCFVLFSVLFRDRVVAFYAVIPVLFGGLTASTLGQYMLSPLYLLPAALLAAYLLGRDRDPAWLLALVFLVCVSANHYLPHYLVLSITGYLVGVGLVVAAGRRGQAGPDAGRRPGAPRLGPAVIAAALLVCAAALAPAAFVHREARGLMSPTRGNVAVADGGIGVQPGVNQSLDRYRYLVHLPRLDPADASWENLEYAHGVFFVGWIPVLLAIGSLAAYRQSDYRAFLLAFALVAMLALGEAFPAWRLLTAHVPSFYLRHSYPLSLTLTLLVVILSAFGLVRLVPWRGAQVVVCALILIWSLQATRHVHGDTSSRPPFQVAPLVYPSTRGPYADRVARVPLDSGPIITKRAVATHVNDDFILFRTRSFHELIQRDLPFTVGRIFGWSRGLEWTPPDLDGVPSEIQNGSFERWEPGGPPSGFEVRAHGGVARIEENRERGWVRDGSASARMLLSPGATVRLTQAHPRAASLRDRFFDLSACLAGPAQPAVGVAVTVLQPNGYDILTPHTYRGGEGWDCLRRTFLVGGAAAALELTLAVSGPAGADVYLDRLELRVLPDPALRQPRPAAERWVETRDPNRIVLWVDAPEDSYLVRKENYHRGWSASLDGRPVPIERFAGAFQAIALTRGPHTVAFTFSSAYPYLMWTHVVAVFVGYLMISGYLLRAAGAVGRPA